jgi:hypothetical protein
MPTDRQAATGGQAGQKKKKPYSKPACVSEKIFETTALACGKRAGQGGLCQGSPRTS